MFNPILSKEEFPRWRVFISRPKIEPGVAVVLYMGNGKLCALKEGANLTAGEFTWQDYRGYYRVDVTPHDFKFEEYIPCKGDVYSFKSMVRVFFHVHYPDDCVRDQLHNVESLIQPLILQQMRELSRSFAAEECEKAEKEINVNLIPLNVSGVVTDKVIVSLELDPSTREQIKKSIVRDATHADKKKEQEQELELKTGRLNFYNELLQQGKLGMLALFLAEHPGDVQSVIAMINQQQQIERDAQLTALKLMLDHDVLEGMHIEESGKQILQKLVDGLVQNQGRALGSGTVGQSLVEKAERRKSEGKKDDASDGKD